MNKNLKTREKRNVKKFTFSSKSIDAWNKLKMEVMRVRNIYDLSLMKVIREIFTQDYRKHKNIRQLQKAQRPALDSSCFSNTPFKFKKEIGKNWFTNRVVDEWNRLSSHVVNAKSIGCFKNRLDKFMDSDDRW